MAKRFILTAFLAVLLGVVFLALARRAEKLHDQSSPPHWVRVTESGTEVVHRCTTTPSAYLIEANGRGVLIDCPEDIPDPPVLVDLVLLTHSHRDTVGGVQKFLDRKVPVRARKISAEWLTAANVTKFWKESIPLRNSRTGYFVHPTGFDGIDCTLDDGQTIDWKGLKLEVVATPGHSPDHLAFMLNNTAFVGDAITSDGYLWTPFTTDWDHWQDAGLKAAAESLRKLAAKGVTREFAARTAEQRTPGAKTAELGGPEGLLLRAKKIDEAAFLKSFERFTNRLGNPPQYDFLVPKEQVGSGGDKPWSKVSDSLWITGNTYVLKSKDSGGVMVLDPWGQRGVDQVAKLRAVEKLGPVELVMFSHAHYDHFDGVYTLPEKGKYKIWALEQVADPLREPFKYRAPFLDERPITFDKVMKEGESATWHEYTFKFHHLPGQTEFTSGIETTIDGKHCLFTADNWFHYTQYSGSGGWMGLNRSFPSVYAESAKKVLKINPERVLAEHGGPYVFNREDFERRVKWGEAAAKTCDAVCAHQDHRRDWDPNAVSVSPVLVRAKAGEVVTIRITGAIRDELVTIRGRGLIPDQSFVTAGGSGTRHIQLPSDIKPGRHVFAICPQEPGGEFTDPFFAVDILP